FVQACPDSKRWHWRITSTSFQRLARNLIKRFSIAFESRDTIDCISRRFDSLTAARAASKSARSRASVVDSRRSASGGVLDRGPLIVNSSLYRVGPSQSRWLRSAQSYRLFLASVFAGGNFP